MKQAKAIQKFVRKQILAEDSRLKHMPCVWKRGMAEAGIPTKKVA